MNAVGSAPAAGEGNAAATGEWGSTRRVMVVYEEGRAGAAALREAAELAASGAELVVVTLAPQPRPMRCCRDGGTGAYNCALRELAAEELVQARALLGAVAARASFVTLIGTPRLRLGAWSAEQAFDTIIVPAQWLARGGGALARELRRETSSQVRVVRSRRHPG